ncbi:MAG TPA: TonB-dependent receptor [Terriglobales bacterium]|nr:TonB-dependent receptor [Terriglobales bacterium]
MKNREMFTELFDLLSCASKRTLTRDRVNDRYKNRVSILNCILFTVIVGPILAYGQADMATIVGRVVDSSGAGVTNAAVTIVNLGSNLKTSAKTNIEGEYVATPLRIGDYSINVEAPGFKAATRAGIVLQVQDRLRVDFVLQVGSTNEQITVTDAPPLLQSETSALGDVVRSQQITDLPLNGRDYTQLVALTTGVTKITENGSIMNGSASATDGNAGGSFAVNGTRGLLNNFLLDGIDNNSNDYGRNSLVTNVDAIAEFKIQTSNYSAEFGRSGGAVINATIKSGTNSFHGTVFDFLRNSVLDARGFFEAPNSPKAPFHQNIFGGTFGGPIKKGKLFFFGDYQGIRIGTSQTDLSIVPTPAEIKGDFSALLPAGTIIYDPGVGCGTIPGTCQANRTAFPGNIIPTNRMDPIARNYAALYPAPNYSSPGNGFNYIANDPGRDRIDQGDVRVDYNISDKQQLFGRFSLSHTNKFQHPALPGLADGGGGGGFIDDTHGAAVGYTYTISSTMVNDLRVGFNRESYTQGVPGYGVNPPPAGLAISGVPSNSQTNGITQFNIAGDRGLGWPGFEPTINSPSQEVQLGDTLNWIHGKHALKIGAQIRFSQENLLQIAQPRGYFVFAGTFTSQTPLSGNGGTGFADALLGLPYFASVGTSETFQNRQNTYGGFIQDDYKILPKLTLNLGLRYDYTTPIVEANNHQANFDFATGQLVIAGQNGASRGLVTTDKDDFAPRIGLSWQVLPKTVVRSGYGRFFAYQEVRTGDPFQLAYNPPFIYQPTYLSDGQTPLTTVSQGFPAPNSPLASPVGVTISAGGVGTHLHAPVLDEWNLNIQHELPAKILVELAYVGSKSTHLQAQVDNNQVVVPGPGAIQPRRPYPQWGGFTDIVDRGNSNYHALQLKVEKQPSRGLYFLSSFTFSKAIDDQPSICCANGDPQNSYNLRAERGPTDFDSKFRWVNSWDYQLPVGKGQRLWDTGGVVDQIFGGWHVGGVFTIRTGFYFSPAMGFDPSNTGSFGLARTDRICNGNLSGGKRSINNWFDVNCFPLPAQYTWGDSGKNVLEGPGEVTADLALRKIFNTSDSTNVEFRFELFNAFNHPVFGLPDNFITDGPGSTGVITSTVVPSRELEFALKFHF